MRTLIIALISSICISRSQQLGLWTNIKPVHAAVEPGGRIIGGEEVEPHSRPYQVGLSINGYQYFCGGALISRNYVLTAAHCGIVIWIVDVILGAHDITNSAESTQVIISGEETILHEFYNDTSYLNDIALIKLSQSVIFNDYIQPIKLPPNSNRVYNYEIATATGWGLTKDVPNPSLRDTSPVLMSVDVIVTNMTDCASYYNDDEYTFLTSGNICTTGHRNKGTCEGDSGGPLALDGFIIGITSFGATLCEMCTPSVYTRVDQYLDWIRKNSDIVVK